MAVVELGGGGTQTPFVQSGTTAILSRIIPSEGSVSGAITSNGNSTNQIPVLFTSLTLPTLASTTLSGTTYTSNATYQLIVAATAGNGTNLYTSGSYTSYGSKTVSPNVPAFSGTTYYYGFAKNSASTLVFKRGASSDTTQNPNNIYLNGTASSNYTGTAIVGSISYTGVPGTAPTLTVSKGASDPKTQADLSWTAVSGTGYRVVYQNVTDSGSWVAWSGGKITGTSVTISGLTAGKQYQFRVAATNATSDAHNSTYTSIGAQCGVNSAAKSVTLDPATPAPVWSTSTNFGTLDASSNYSFYVSASDTESYSIVSHSGWASTPTVTTYSSGAYAYVDVSTPSTAGSASVTVRATGPGGSTDRTFTATIVLQDAYWTDTTITTDLVLNKIYTGGTLQAANTRASSPYSISGVLPNGLSFSTSTGDITGTPVINIASLPSISHVIGAFPITVTAYGLSGNQITTSFTLNVRYPGKFVNSGTIPSSNVGSTVGIRRKAENGESGQDINGFKPVQWVRRWDGSAWQDAAN